MNKVGVLIVLVISFLLSCKSAVPNKGAKSFSKYENIVAVHIGKTPCKGKCPQYEADFYLAGKMVYNGINHVPLKGKFEYVIPTQLITNILLEAKKIKYSSFKDSYPATNADVPITVTIITSEGKTKRIAVQEGAPDILLKFQKSLHEEVMAIITEQEGKALVPKVK